MTERSTTSFVRLFDLRVLHHYWLDEGATEFSSIADSSLRSSRLLRYDIRPILQIEPDAATESLIAGLRGRAKATALGLVVAVPAGSRVPLEATFGFHLITRATDFAGYTALSLRQQKVVDVTDTADGTIHRYRTNVPMLSNQTGASRGSGASKRLFLSREYVAGANAGDGVEALVTSGGNVRQLTGDPANAPFHVLGPRSALPVYVHQGDVPPIVPPAGATGAPARGVELTADMPVDVAAVIRLTPRRADDNAFSFANANGSLRATPRVFEVHLRNRWTTRRYRDKRNGAVVATDANPTALTYFGNAGAKQKPASGVIDVQRDTSTPPRVTRIISEIYV